MKDWWGKNLMKVHVIPSNRFEEADVIEVNLKKCVCAVIDTIRATSTIITILGCGGEKVIVARDKKEAFFLRDIFKESIVCGEEGGLPPEGFDFGNSPLEISGAHLEGRTAIIMTTNGTQSIIKAKQCHRVYALSTLNINACIDCVIESADKSGCDILFLCSGEKGKIAYDDVFTAGLAIKYLLTKPYKLEFTDAAKVALAASLSEFNIKEALEKSCSAKSLRDAGLGDDIAYISKLNRFKATPLMYVENLKKYLDNYSFKTAESSKWNYSDKQQCPENIFIMR